MRNSQWTVFLFSTWSPTAFSACKGSRAKLANTPYRGSLVLDKEFFSCCFKDSFFFFFDSLVVVCLGMGLFGFILLYFC